MPVSIKRIYDIHSPTDGFHILIDRLWPRGIKKAGAGIDLWMKEIAPSTALRKWFHEGKGSWAEFRKKYIAELKGGTLLNELQQLSKKHTIITLLYASKDTEQNHAIILKQLIKT